jgi:hypothetical protein
VVASRTRKQRCQSALAVSGIGPSVEGCHNLTFLHHRYGHASCLPADHWHGQGGVTALARGPGGNRITGSGHCRLSPASTLSRPKTGVISTK